MSFESDDKNEEATPIDRMRPARSLLSLSPVPVSRVVFLAVPKARGLRERIIIIARGGAKFDEFEPEKRREKKSFLPTKRNVKREKREKKEAQKSASAFYSTVRARVLGSGTVTVGVAGAAAMNLLLWALHKRFEGFRSLCYIRASSSSSSSSKDVEDDANILLPFLLILFPSLSFVENKLNASFTLLCRPECPPAGFPFAL